MKQRRRAKKLIEAIEQQRKGREGAHTDVSNYAVANSMEIVSRFSLLLSCVMMLWNTVRLRSVTRELGPLEFVFLVIGVILGWCLLAMSVKSRVFYGKKRLCELSSCLVMMKAKNAQISVMQEEQSAVRAKFENLQCTIATHGGRLDHHEKYTTTAPYWEETFCLQMGDDETESEVRLSVRPTEKNLKLIQQIMTVYEEHIEDQH